MSSKSRSLFERRRGRVRARVARLANPRPRLSAFRSSRHIYVQLIDDLAGRTLAAASTLDKERRDGGLAKGSGNEAAAAVGKLIATRAQAAGVKSVVFDRGGY